MHLAVMVGAEDSIRRWVKELEQENTLSEGWEMADVFGDGMGEVGKVDVVPVVFSRKSGEFALNLGEEQGAQVISTTFQSRLSIRNDSSVSLNMEALTAEGPRLTIDAEGPQVLIVHTHGSEAYTQSGADTYVESDPYRTEDKSQNIIKVGDVLAEALEAEGLSVIHDREIYDYPSYTGSYSRSGKAVEQYLAKYPSIAVVIDLHRDALGSGDTVYKTMAQTPLGDCAQVMLLVGTGENGLYHPDWEENLKLALCLQKSMEETYPSLARPLSVKSERYNQHLSTGAIIVEVGSTGNTLSEAMTAVKLFGQTAGRTLKSFVKTE